MCYGSVVMHSSMVYESKTYRVYSRVVDEIKNGKLTHRAVSVYLSWLLEKSISKLQEVVETSEEEPHPLLQTALDNLEKAYNDLCLAREGTADDIKQVLVDENYSYIDNLQIALLCLSKCRHGLMPMQGEAGEHAAAISAASTNIASALCILQDNAHPVEKNTDDTRARLCGYLDSLVDLVESLPEDAFLCVTQGVGEYDFAVNSTAKASLLLSLEELRAIASTIDHMADDLSRECIQKSFAAVLAPVKVMISILSQAPDIRAQTALHCLLANRLIENSEKAIEGYTQDQHTSDKEMNAEDVISSATLCTAGSALRLLASCANNPPAFPPCTTDIVKCAGQLVKSYYKSCCYNRHSEYSSDAEANLHFGDVLGCLCAARESLDGVDASALPSNRDREALARLRNGIMRASERCVAEQVAEPDLIEPAPGAGWDALSVEEVAPTAATAPSLYI
ncbi:hypothetical protein [Anaplasma phagocytophilum]|nr:hypothetical protein [Anaplasma phagocytophilum]KJV82717.1 hypothetical protein APHHGE2_1144 [Anaplasma phagocytophilum str. HGE2]KJZ98798.1 hypothetical protein APHCR_0347 [Anaplasma phagocytophilum str. CR1007]AGR82014.1 hypothetical protein YYY_03890 [Anaplasma phagocytophilum str. Dog2]EOA61114.1 hypothetical protein HGE1_03637 [Anaplasma phagocytophilum str. HGE1]KJV98858.1 hypothetical protein OTSANNIE_1116 [Anaplasma phagocytophilum str. Annie]